MKQYIVFGYYYDYPSGGLNDVIFQSDEFMDVIDMREDWNRYDELQLLGVEKGMTYVMDEGYWKETGRLKSKNSDVIKLKDEWR